MRILTTFFAAALTVACLSLGAVAADFAPGAAPGWEASPGMTITETQDGFLVEGTQGGAWNYAYTKPFPIEPGAFYRVTGRMKVERAEPQLPPYFNVEFAAKTAEGYDMSIGFGQATGARYDFEAGGWQAFEVEFEAPRRPAGAHFALDKGTQAPVTIEVRLADIAVEEVEQLSATEDYGFETPPQPLSTLAGVHPRLHLDAKRAAEIKVLVKTDAKYRAMFEEIRTIADRGVESGPPKYVLDDRWSGTEQLWQRGVGEMLPHLAMAHLVTGEEKYLDSARDWMVASCGYETWGLPPFENIDLAAGHQLYGLAVAYDWLYHDLDEATRETVRECFRRQAEFMFRQAASEQAWWHNSYLQNHLWVNITGLAAAGMAVYGEVEGAERWIALPLEKYRVTFAALGDDGASHEGIGYWTYGLEYMLKFTDLAEGLLGEDFLDGHEWFRLTPYYRLYAALPRDVWARPSSIMTFADSRRFDWYGPEFMLRLLASKYRNAHAQWLADAVDEADICGRTATFLNLVWYDPSVAAEGPEDLPTFRHFGDMDTVYGRSGWSGGETVWAFKCGPHIGHTATEMFDYDPGGGHVHPDAGSFQIHAGGQWLIVDDGYTWKTTEFQNTALVNGVGQEGEGRAWFQGGDLCLENRGARIISAASGQAMDFAIGDVTDAYKREAGLEKFIRHFYHVKPATWVVVDEFEAARASKFELFFHGANPFEKTPGGVWRSAGEKAALELVTLLPGDAEAEAFKQQLKSTGGSAMDEKLDTLKVSNPMESERAVFVTVMTALGAGETSAFSAALEEDAGATILTIETPAGLVRFRLALERDDPGMSVLVPLE